MATFSMLVLVGLPLLPRCLVPAGPTGRLVKEMGIFDQRDERKLYLIVVGIGLIN